MSMSFKITALDHELFLPLSGYTDEQLAEIGAMRVTVDEKPGYPCRVSLVEAELGERVLSLHFTHHDVRSPYRASGPIFVREGARTARFAPGELPEMLLHRPLSVRAYDQHALMVGSVVTHGSDLEQAIMDLFADESVAYLHVHNAGAGCYDCSVERI